MINERWLLTYALAKKYYEHYGNLLISQYFRTRDGINCISWNESRENSIDLGAWLNTQRQQAKKGILDPKKIELLDKIGMIWEDDKDLKSNLINYSIGSFGTWMNNYNLVKKYYETNGNLKIPKSFITKDGINPSEYGFEIGKWIRNQKNIFKKPVKTKLDEKKIELLEQIGIKCVQDNVLIDVDGIQITKKWMDNYELAKNYYNENGNLNVHFSFITKDGINYDENGTQLGNWVRTQKKLYEKENKDEITQKKIDLLNEIGMVYVLDEDRTKIEFDGVLIQVGWIKRYELVKLYLEENGNIDIPLDYKIEEGISLYQWLRSQKKLKNKQNKDESDLKKIDLLDQIGMNWDSKKNKEKPKYDKEYKREIEEEYRDNYEYDYEEEIYLNLGFVNNNSEQEDLEEDIIDQESIEKNIETLKKEQEKLFNQYKKVLEKKIQLSYKLDELNEKIEKATSELNYKKIRGKNI